MKRIVLLFLVIPIVLSMIDSSHGNSDKCSQVILKSRTTKIARKDFSHYLLTLDNGSVLEIKGRLDFVVGIMPADNFLPQKYPFVLRTTCKGSPPREAYVIQFYDIGNFKKYNSSGLNALLWIDAANIRAIRRLPNNRYRIDFYGTNPNVLYHNVPGEGKPDEIFTIEVDATRFRFPQPNARPIFNGFVQGYYRETTDTMSIMVPQITISFATKESVEEYFKVK